MIIATLFFLLSILVGFSIVRLLPLTWHKAEITAASIVVGIFIGSWLGFLFSWSSGYTISPILTLATLIALSILSFYYRPTPIISVHKKFLENKQDMVIWGIATVISIILFSNLFYTHMLMNQHGALMGGGSSWGDLPLHLSLINRFTFEKQFSWDMPIMYGAKLSYPFLIDFFTALLYRWGWTLRLSLLIPSVLLATSIVQLIIFTGKRLLKKISTGALTAYLFLVNGGIGGLLVFWQDWQKSGAPIFQFLGMLTKQYSHLDGARVLFSNLIADYLLPQRGELLGLSLFFLILIFLFEAWSHPKKEVQLLTAATLLAGFLPLAHTHTFFVIAGILGYLTLAKIWQAKTWRTPWLIALLLVLAIAAPQVTWQLKSNFTDNFSHLQFGWMKAPTQNIFLFWLANWGVAIIFAITNFWVIQRLKSPRDFHLHFYTALLILFIITNFYVFQPYDYDNMKFMLYSFFAVCLFSSHMLIEWLKGTAWKKTAALISIISLTIVGCLCVLRESYAIWQLASPEEVALAQFVRTTTNSEDRILTSDQHNHFVPLLTGRQIMMGYHGWLWSYGLTYDPLRLSIGTMYSGSAQTPLLLKKYNISYVVIGPTEYEQYPVNEPYFAAHGKLLTSTERYRIYDVRSLRQ